jgi:hypothetical protein
MNHFEDELGRLAQLPELRALSLADIPLADQYGFDDSPTA